MKRSTFTAAVVAIIIVTLVRVASTERVFSPTFDEHAHMAAGYAWLRPAPFIADPHHPPLARILFALPFRHIAPPPFPDVQSAGNAIFNHDGHYARNVALARVGNLVFLLLAMVIIVLWTKRLFDPAHAVVALLIFTSLPPVLAHAGLATTDMASAASLLFALYALAIWLDQPTWPRTLLLGLAAGVGLSATFLFIPFFAIGAAAMLIVRRRVPSPRVLAAAAIACLLVWGMYKFSWGTMEQQWAGMPKLMEERFGSGRIATISIPAPLYFVSIMSMKQKDERGHAAYLFGRLSQKGWWYYFPVAIAVKTPLPALILTAIGAVTLLRRRQHIELVLILAALLAFLMTRHINLGIRHALHLYPLMAIVAAAGALVLWPRARAVVIGLLLWLVIGTAVAHPDYLAWSNETVGRHPERVLVDSNLDWGQDLLRLARECRRQHIERLGIMILTTANLRDAGLPETYPLSWYEPSRGWMAISETHLQLARAAEPHAFAWLTEGRTYRRVGKSIRLYHVL